MKPLIHAKSSAAKYGGQPEDYMAVHDFMDSSKAALPDIRHRAVLHSAFGIFLAERMFGSHIVNSAGRDVCVRSLAEDHVLEDLGFIPTLEKWLGGLEIQDWMMGSERQQRKINELLLDHGVTEAETSENPGTAEKSYEEVLQEIRDIIKTPGPSSPPTSAPNIPRNPHTITMD
jgi:hypothetical protein